MRLRLGLEKFLRCDVAIVKKQLNELDAAADKRPFQQAFL